MARAADETDPTARFDRLEVAAGRDAADFERWVDVMTQMRVLAADREPLRLRFAASWLRAETGAAFGRDDAVDNDRAAYLWSLGAAHAQRPHAAVLLGHCYREGRGAPRSLRRARRWYRHAAAAGSIEAAFWLRQTQSRMPRWLLYRGPALEWVGLALLLAYFAAMPWVFHPAALLVYVLIAFAGQLVLRWAFERVTPRSEQEDVSTGTELVDGLVARPWQTLAVAGEDGLVLVPLLALGHLFGSTLWVAPVAGLLFGLLHFPNFSWRGCLAKGVTYAVATALIVPWGGVAAMALGHVLLDGFIVAVAWLDRSRVRRGHVGSG
ncbi:MAG: hypothetical protein AAGA54_21100 [Myxococcota bacterium]